MSQQPNRSDRPSEPTPPTSLDRRDFIRLSVAGSMVAVTPAIVLTTDALAEDQIAELMLEGEGSVSHYPYAG